MPASRRRRFGIRARVVASFLVLLVTAELASIAVLRQVGSNRIEEQANRDLITAADDLRVRLEQVQSTLGRPDGPTLSSIFDDFLRARPARGDQAYLAFIGDRPFAMSAGAPVALDRLGVAAQWSAVPTTMTGEVETDAGPMRWLALPVLAGDRLLGVMVMVEFTAGQYDALRGTIVSVSLITFLVLVGASLLAWGAAGRALAPVHELASTARSVSSGDDLDARIEVSSRDEVGELAASFNEMLDRLRTAFDSQNRFLDDAGHDLRTPITIIRGHLELLDEDPEVRAAEVALVLDELDRMDRLVSDLRILARSERPDFLSMEWVDVETFMADLAAKAKAMAPRTWVARTEATGWVRADRQRLTQAVLNLVDNAVHVTADGDAIELGAASRDGSVVLSVRDAGPGIADRDLPTLFDRTERAIGRRPGGTGLGLPIVAAIARAHGGAVSVDSELGVGTTFEILVPGLRDKVPDTDRRTCGKVSVTEKRPEPELTDRQHKLLSHLVGIDPNRSERS